ncbi:unnamed protein product [Caretta caretta]
MRCRRKKTGRPAVPPEGNTSRGRAELPPKKKMAECRPAALLLLHTPWDHFAHPLGCAYPRLETTAIDYRNHADTMLHDMEVPVCCCKCGFEGLSIHTSRMAEPNLEKKEEDSG